MADGPAYTSWALSIEFIDCCSLMSIWSGNYMNTIADVQTSERINGIDRFYRLLFRDDRLNIFDWAATIDRFYRFSPNVNICSRDHRNMTTDGQNSPQVNGINRVYRFFMEDQAI